MKRIFFIISVLAIFSCEKEKDTEPSFCWDCWKEEVSTNRKVSMQFELCDISEAKIEAIISDNTFLSGDTSHSMRCNKKE